MFNPLKGLCGACMGQIVPATMRIAVISLIIAISRLGFRHYNEHSFLIEVQFDVYLSFPSIIVPIK